MMEVPVSEFDGFFAEEEAQGVKYHGIHQHDGHNDAEADGI